MKPGVLLFAFNNQKIDYARMADWSAANIHRHLGLPVCVVTDVDYRFKNVDQVINTRNDQRNVRAMEDFACTVEWHNMNRMDALDLTPWDHTIVLDVDYVVASDQLKVLLDQPDFLCHDTARDVTGLRTDAELNIFGSFKHPMLWATVMSFRRNQETRDIFDVMKMVRDNWQHYCDLFAVRRSPYRNDFSLSIAAGVVNGHTLLDKSIPWPLHTVIQSHDLVRVSNDHYRVEFVNTKQKRSWIELRNQDFHAMGKRALGDIIASQA